MNEHISSVVHSLLKQFQDLQIPNTYYSLQVTATGQPLPPFNWEEIVHVTETGLAFIPKVDSLAGCICKWIHFKTACECIRTCSHEIKLVRSCLLPWLYCDSAKT